MEKLITHTFVVLAYKQSEYLEKCIDSVKNQSVKTNIVIATSTPNNYINELAKKYRLNVIVNNEKKGIGNDFDFALNCTNTDIVTIAHQDDIYDYDYAENMIKMYKKYYDAIIFIPKYYEIKNDNKIYNNVNLFIKRILLFSLSINKFNHLRVNKRNSIRFGSAIGCPSVSFAKKNIPSEIFNCDMKCNIDWYGWEKLSKEKGRFVYINKFLMGHRLHNKSTTTEIINENSRTTEDYNMFLKFWPKPIAKIISKIYKLSEKNNKS